MASCPPAPPSSLLPQPLSLPRLPKCQAGRSWSLTLGKAVQGRPPPHPSEDGRLQAPAVAPGLASPSDVHGMSPSWDQSGPHTDSVCTAQDAVIWGSGSTPSTDTERRWGLSRAATLPITDHGFVPVTREPLTRPQASRAAPRQGRSLAFLGVQPSAASWTAPELQPLTVALTSSRAAGPRPLNECALPS